jgi:hypothetical protein
MELVWTHPKIEIQWIQILQGRGSQPFVTHVPQNQY